MQQLQINKKHLFGREKKTETSDLHYILIPHHSQNNLKEFNFTFLSLSPKGSS